MKLRSMWSQLVLVSLFAGVAGHAQAQESPIQQKTARVVPQLIKFSGTLFDQHMQPTESPVGVTFALYAQQSGGAALWLETQNVEVDAKGNYTALIGANSAHGVPMELFTSGEARWLSIQGEREPEQPRVLLVSVPYALKAGDAQTLGGLPPSAFALSSASAATNQTVVVAVAPNGPMTPSPSTGTLQVTTAGGTLNNVAKFDAKSDITNSQIVDNGTNVGIGTCTPGSKLDVCGTATIRGALQLPSTSTAGATALTGFSSQPLDLLASAWNSSTKAAVSQHFRWQAEPSASNTTTPSGKLNLLFASGTGTPVETGFSISSKGLITFATGQTLPAISGNETVTGNVSASQLISNVSTGTAPLTVNSTTVVPNLNASLLGGHTSSAFALLAASNNFTGNQAVTGNIAATGKLSIGGSVGIGTSTPLSNLDVVGFQHILIGNTGCGGSLGGIGFGPLSLSNCLNYSLLGEGFNTYVNRPAGGQILFRESNADQMVLASGGNVGIGTSFPGFLLHVNGLVRAETGLSMGGSSSLSIDAPGVVGGQFLVKNGTVSIGGDTPMSSNPHMSFSTLFSGSMCNGFLVCGGGHGNSMGAFFTDKNILITRMVTTLGSAINPSCLPGEITVHDQGTYFGTKGLPTNQTLVDSGPLTIAVPAGHVVEITPSVPSAGLCNFGTSAGGDVWINVNYVMQ